VWRACSAEEMSSFRAYLSELRSLAWMTGITHPQLNEVIHEQRDERGSSAEEPRTQKP